ncbi:ABC transporter permease [Sphingobium lignivorans]|uniref:ABC-2 type transport system permease protein n=1 Tax=Sphingobium lignivorans TaxID=2735886 RepID=A0ABR6NBN3_9SPHN|nr:ABC transporter permease [Sphingobium lignivorans]MBB5984694.1 ABC-2 type transport system permease protein [Sphingobium lignivorans]
MRLANIMRLGIKEMRSLWRDRMMVVLILWAFTGSVYVAATGIPETLNKAPIAIIDEDGSQLSRRIVGAFYPPYFNPPVMITQSDIDAAMDQGLYTFVLDIPPNFQRDLLAGRNPAIQLNVDATRMAQAFSGNAYVQQIVNREIADYAARGAPAAALPVDVAVRARFNSNLTSLWFGGVMEVINHVTLLSIILTGAALIREREHGTVEHLLVMPVTPFEIMAAKVWSMGLVVLVATWFSLSIIVRGAMQVPIEGSVGLFLLGAAAHLFATTSMGIFLGTFARSMPQFGLLVILTIVPLELLSGGSTPRESMPQAVQDVMLAAPTTHFVKLAQGILYRGANISVVWPQLLAIIAIGVVFYAVALAQFRKAINTMA